jgi:hypothetical protein
VIKSFVVRLGCEYCHGEKKIPGGQREYGEMVACPACRGHGTVEGYVPYEDFAKLIEDVYALAVKRRT